MFKSLTSDFYFSGPHVLLFLRSSWTPPPPPPPLFDFRRALSCFHFGWKRFCESSEDCKTGVQLGGVRRYLFKFVCAQDDEKKEERVLLPPFCRRPLLCVTSAVLLLLSILRNNLIIRDDLEESYKYLPRFCQKMHRWFIVSDRLSSSYSKLFSYDHLKKTILFTKISEIAEIH